jgi:hypothetical protein
MADLQLQLTAEEQKYLRELLENVLKETEVEEHRTRKPSFREYVIQKERLIRQVLAKLPPPAA